MKPFISEKNRLKRLKWAKEHSNGSLKIGRMSCGVMSLHMYCDFKAKFEYGDLMMIIQDYAKEM